MRILFFFSLADYNLFSNFFASSPTSPREKYICPVLQHWDESNKTASCVGMKVEVRFVLISGKWCIFFQCWGFLWSLKKALCLGMAADLWNVQKKYSKELHQLPQPEAWFILKLHSRSKCFSLRL